MALSITVNGAGTFSASMEEGPVSFSASLAAVGPQGPAGATGPAGVVAATAPITYNAGTQTVGISATPTFTSVGFTSPGSPVLINAEYFIPFSATYDVAGMEYRGDKVVFPDNTEQVTAFVGEARKEYITARNNTGSTIAKGSVVYLSGATGNKPTMALAQANSESTSARTIGILVEETAANGDGKVIISGAAENIDTSAFTAGQVVYLSSSVAGGLQTTLPTQPNHGVVIGIVTRANPSVGSIEVTIQNYQELGELSDVLLVSKTNLDLLSWDSATSVWKNKSFSTLGLLTSSTAASTYLAKASNLSDLANASTARTNLGLGTMAVETASDYLTKAGNLSGLTSTSTARTNLGLGTMATETASDYLTKAGNLSGLASTSNARTNLGLGTMAVETASNYALLASPALTGTPTAPTAAAATNTTQIATTAFVQQEVPAASTTAAGKVELATNAEAVQKTDTAKALTPYNLVEVLTNGNFSNFNCVTFDNATSGTGGTNVNNNGGLGRLLRGPTSTGAGHVRAGMQIIPQRGGNTNTAINWSKVVRLSARLLQEATSPSSESIYRFVLGETGSINTGDLAVRGISVKVAGSGVMQLQVHDGTTLTTYNTSYTPSVAVAFDLVLVSNGSGTVEAFVDGSSVGSTTGGPSTSGSSGQNYMNVRIENTSSFTTNRAAWYSFNICADIIS